MLEELLLGLNVDEVVLFWLEEVGEAVAFVLEELLLGLEVDEVDERMLV